MMEPEEIEEALEEEQEIIESLMVSNHKLGEAIEAMRYELRALEHSLDGESIRSEQDTE